MLLYNYESVCSSDQTVKVLQVHGLASFKKKKEHWRLCLDPDTSCSLVVALLLQHSQPFSHNQYRLDPLRVILVHLQTIIEHGILLVLF